MYTTFQHIAWPTLLFGNSHNISIRLYCKNAVLQGIAPPQNRRLSFFLFQSNTRKYTCLAQHVHFFGFLVTKLLWDSQIMRSKKDILNIYQIFLIYTGYPRTVDRKPFPTWVLLAAAVATCSNLKSFETAHWAQVLSLISIRNFSAVPLRYECKDAS